MNHISEILKKSNNGIGNYGRAPQQEQQANGRQYTVTPLNEFQFKHLSRADEQRLRAVVAGVRKWINEAPVTAGLSIVLCGSFGTGKTTMAENAMNAFRVPMIAKSPNAEMQAQLIYAAIQNQPMSDEVKATLEQQAQALLEGECIGEVLQGSLKTATDVMSLTEGGIDLNFGRDQVIVIDDLGTEEIPYTNESTFQSKRQARYGNLIDYCYRNGKLVIVTSNVPLFEGDYINQEFIDIMGGRAFDRLFQMADGFTFDLTGLPSYRPYMVKR